MTVSPNAQTAENELIRAVLTFASLKGVREPGEVYQLFNPFGIGGKVARLAEASIEAAAIFEADRVLLVHRLQMIVTDRSKAEQSLRAVINRAVLEKRAYVVPQVATDGEMRLQLFGVEAGVYLALALLLDPGRGLGALLRRCGRDRCDNYFLLKSLRGGRPDMTKAKRYCTPEHAKEQNTIDAGARMRKIRAAKKAEKLKQRRAKRRGGDSYE